MKCPECGVWTEVLATRDRTRRRRECANGHRFWTREVVEEPVPNRRALEWQRLRTAAVRMVTEGRSHRQAAAALGVHHKTVAGWVRNAC